MEVKFYRYFRALLSPATFSQLRCANQLQMFSFSDYKQLSWEVRSLATRYWVAWIKGHLGVRAAYQLKKSLLSVGDIAQKQPGWLNNSSRFWNRKESGQPVMREALVDQVEACAEVRGAKAILCHPFWQLVDCRQPSSEALNRILLQLPSNYVGKLFSDEARGIRKHSLRVETRIRLEMPYDLNALTYFLVLAIEESLAEREKSTEASYHIQIMQIMVIKMFLRQSVLTPLSVIAEELYKTISDRFEALFSTAAYWPFHQPFTDRNLKVNCIITGFFSGNESLFQHSLKLFSEWLVQATKIHLINDTERDKKAFLWSVMITEADRLESTLFHTPPENLERTPYAFKLKQIMDDFRQRHGS